jgi:N-acetylmuramoyl-L-alanine amidase
MKTTASCPPPLRALALFSVILLAACAGPGPRGIKLDRSIQAVGQDSRAEFLVVHYTSANDATSLKVLSQHKVSSHYLITQENPARVYQLVDENRRAWHAGHSEWYGRTYLNNASIGVEVVNRGNEGGQWEPYSPEQLRVLTLLLKDIIARHDIKPRDVVGHSDIAPQRKIDPGPLFPWKQLAQAGIGRWYDETLAQTYAQQFEQSGLPGAGWIQNELRRVGYATPDTGELDKATRNVIAAFQMRYRPQRYDGYPDAQTLGILRALP